MDAQLFSRDNPYYARIKERFSLCKPGSSKETVHVVLDLGKSGIQYTVGDSIGVLPANDPLEVNKILALLKASGEEMVLERKGRLMPFRDFLTYFANLKGVSKKILQEIAIRHPLAQRKKLEQIFHEERKEELKVWLHTHALWEALEEFPEVRFTPQDIADLAMPLLPRFYSIASSQLLVGDEVHLTVAYLHYEMRGHLRLGVATHFLAKLAPLDEPIVPIYIHTAADFHLPEDPKASMIMIGPGTGVAPFRAFLQEREAKGEEGRNWLFFGERTKEREFFYENEWNRWIEKGLLQLELAFSRDQPHKIYVQHRMRERGEEIARWIDEGAYLYVCGDAHQMAKDVDQTLHEILQQHLHLTPEETKGYVKQLRHAKRYLRDIY